MYVCSLSLSYLQIIKQDFGLTIDIEELINKIDTDGSGEIEYEEFKT
jgi:calmodulin